MTTGQNNQLTRQIGEHLVTAELGRRGIIASPFAGNVQAIDILAYKDGKAIPIQVKAINKDSWQFDIRKFLKVEIEGDRQIVNGANPDFDKQLLCIFVKLNDCCSDEFYIFRQSVLFDHFSTYEGRIKPRNINSFHCAIWTKDLKEHKDKWNLVME